MYKKYLITLIVSSLIICQLVHATCGSCPGDKKEAKSAFIEEVPENGKVNGKALASCGMCNFGYKKNKGCSLTIKIGDTVYPVEGTSIHDHGDAHSEEGFCLAVRVAHVSGKIKKNKFYSDSFTLIESPK